MATRYDEKNCNAQCRSCNRFNEGSLYGYSKGLDDKYGAGTAERLHIKEFNVCKMSEVELDILINYYKKKLNEQTDFKPF